MRGSVGIFHLQTQGKVSRTHQVKERYSGDQLQARILFPPPLSKRVVMPSYSPPSKVRALKPVKTLQSLQWPVPTDKRKGVFSAMDECPMKGNRDQVNGELHRLIQLKSKFHFFLLP